MSDSGNTAARTKPDRSARGGPAQLGNALDVMRIAGTFVVLMYHASLAYLSRPMRLTLWHVYDPGGHVAMDVFAYWVNGFVMPLFFLAAGVSAPAGIESRGLRSFLNHRANRLLRPLLFGCVAFMPFLYLLWGYGLLVSGQCTADEILSWRHNPRIAGHLYGIGHLWFLQYLFLVCVVWGLAWTIGRRVNISGFLSTRLESALTSRWRPLWMALPTCAVFLLDTDTVLRVENAILPNPSRLIHYLYFFAAGGWISRLPDPKGALANRGRTYLVSAMVVFAIMTPSLLRLASAPLYGVERVLFCIPAALFPWLVIFGGLGICLKRIEAKGPVLRFLSESSFWVYLIHVPVVTLMQVLLLPFPWPGALKFTVASIVGAAASLITYEYVARYSIVGEVVNGARKRLKERRPVRTHIGWMACLALMIAASGGAVWSLRTFLWHDNYFAVRSGILYRSARLSNRTLADAMRRDGLRTVVTISGGGDKHAWFREQQALCLERGVRCVALPLGKDAPPSRERLAEILRVLETCPRPILVQGYRGLDHCAFTAALGLMAEGTPPEIALRQFSARYAQFGGAEHSALGRTLLAYEATLKAEGRRHSPAELRRWVEKEYLVTSMPPKPRGPAAVESVARQSSGTAVR